MKRFVSTLCATALAASVGLVGAVPATGAPVYVPKAQSAEYSDVVQVNRHWKKKRPRGFYTRNNHGYYNGYRGYRHKRSGYRYHNGWWFPLGAFVAGAVVGGAIADSNRRTVYVSDAHVRYCHDRYRSYREWDNSWQPYNGPRRQCISPYM